MSDTLEQCLGRIARKVCFGGLVGIAGGAYAAVVYTKPLGNSCWVGFHGCVILMGYFAIFQEAARSARKVADPVNSWMAGTATGYIVSASQHGYRSGIRTGLYGGLAVGGLHYLKDQLPVGLVRKLLVSWDLLDAQEESDSPAETITDELSEDVNEHILPWWERYIPFQRMHQQEIASREALKAEMLERMKQQSEPPQPRTAELQQALYSKGTDDPNKN